MNTQYLRFDIHQFQVLTGGWELERIGFLMKIIRLAWSLQKFPIPELEEEPYGYGFDKRVFRRLYNDKMKDAVRILISQRALVEDWDRQRVFDQSGGKCTYCREEITFDRFHVDHFIPVKRGGLSNEENLRASCPSCNMKKHAKLPMEACDAR